MTHAQSPEKIYAAKQPKEKIINLSHLSNYSTRSKPSGSPVRGRLKGPGASEHVASVVVRGGEERSAGAGVRRWRWCWGGEVWKGLQAHLLVLLKLPHHHPAKLLAVALAGVQQLANFGGARGLIGHQLVVLAHQ